MRYLKNKIAQAKAFRDLQLKRKELGSPSSDRKNKEILKTKKSDSEREDGKATKNIAQNFGRAICTFVASAVAEPYLIPLLEKERVTLAEFRNHMNQIKDSIKGLCHFREALLISDKDSFQVQAFKRLFCSIGEIFIKYFSVNWIFNGKMNYRKAYLKYRFKMLRRIQSPELFTYLR